MKLRVPAAILLIAALFLAACGGESDEEKAQKAIADAIEEATKDLDNAPDDAADEQTDDNADEASDDQSDDSTDDGVDTSLPNMENLGECMEIGFSYAALGLVSLGGMMGGEQISDADLAELKTTIDDLNKKLPKEIQADFAIVAEAYNTAAKEGFMSSKGQAALESEKFTKANDKVAAYIEDLCE